MTSAAKVKVMFPLNHCQRNRPRSIVHSIINFGTLERMVGVLYDLDLASSVSGRVPAN